MFEHAHEPRHTAAALPKRPAVGAFEPSQLLLLQRQAGNAALARALHTPSARPVVLQRALVADKLNVVGETHTESDPRRPAEKAFSKAMTGSGNYWTEAEFPDLHMAVSGRRKRAQAQPQGEANADLMEFRAAHAAALLVAQYQKTALAAGVLVASGDPLQSDDGRGLSPALRTFIDEDLRKLVKYKARVERSWRATQTSEVNSAVKKLFDLVENIEKRFLETARDPSTRRKALLFLQGANDVIKKNVVPLATAVGFPDSADLADEMRVARSRMMALAAEASSQKGVWKVGDLHVKDVLDEKTKTLRVKAHYERKADFDVELAAWRGRQNQS